VDPVAAVVVTTVEVVDSAAASRRTGVASSLSLLAYTCHSKSVYYLGRIGKNNRT
jgi:hypothetical protein